MIESAMRTISFVSCIKFLEWDGEAKDYVHFKPDKKRLGWVFAFLSLSKQFKWLEKFHQTPS